MRDLLAAIFRSLIALLVFLPLTYYIGMVLVRVSRRLRKYYYNPSAQPEFHTVRLAGSQKMKVDRNSYMGGSIYWSGFHHLNELLYLHRRLKRSDVFMDIGANQGEFSIFAAGKVPEGRVISFEPVARNRTLLNDNIQLNNIENIEVHPYGLSDTPGSLPIYTSSRTEVHHGLHEGLSTLYPSGDRTMLEETVALKVYDDNFNSIACIDFIKIDIEGAELFALKGMINMLAACKPEILIEINEETFNAAGYRSVDMIKFLTDLGYHPYTIKRGRAKRISLNELSAWGNYIFKQEE